MSNDDRGVVDEFLEWLLGQADANPGQGIDCGDYLVDRRGMDLARALEFVRVCGQRDLVHEHNSMGKPACWIAEGGRSRVQAMRRERTDPARRIKTAYGNLLRWLYLQELGGWPQPDVLAIMGHPEGKYLGTPLTVEEIQRAAEHLQQRGLIDGPIVAEIRGPIRASLTADGQDCMTEADGDVGAFLRDRQQRTSAISYHNTFGDIHNQGVMAVASTNVTQHAALGFDPAAMGRFVEVLLGEVSRLQLGTAAEPARSALAEAKTELASARPDRGRVADAVGRFIGYVADCGKPALQALLMGLGIKYGLPLAAAPSTPTSPVP